MSDRLAVLPQYLMPKQLLTELAGKFANARLGGLTTAVIRRFVARYGVDMQEAADPDIASYASFNEFFPRKMTVYSIEFNTMPCTKFYGFIQLFSMP